VSAAKKKLSQIKDPDGNIANMMLPFGRSIDDAMSHLEEQKEWLQKYFSKGKFGRATSFTKYTWMGIPLN
jgi:predicted metal-dependent hydrolase